MGLTYIEGTVQGPGGKESRVTFHVDSGATYSLLPRPIWETLELVPKREETFSLADGTPIIRNVSECYLTIPQGDGHTPVILEEEGDEALLGVITLEELGLVFNPFKRTLQRMRLRLAWIAKLRATA